MAFNRRALLLFAVAVSGVVAVLVIILVSGNSDPDDCDGCRPEETVVQPSQSLFEPGTGTFEFDADGFGPHPDKKLDVWYFAPDGDLRDVRILVVMPGRGRNGEEYRDDWLDEVQRDNVLLLVPQFPDDDFSMEEYNLGNLVEDSGDPAPSDEWTFAVIERLYEHVGEEIESTEPGYYLYGHSAGAQFVHRFMVFIREAMVIKAVSANVGWYTVPDRSVEYPYGLRHGPPVGEGDIVRMLAAPLVILLGSEDDDPDADGLHDDEGTRAQGATRLERGIHFFEVGEKVAGDAGVPFGWDLRFVEGVGHTNDDMAKAAAVVLFG